MAIDKRLITDAVLNNTLRKEVYPEIRAVAPVKMGKVRTVYDVGGNELIMISSDDLSTHDVVHRRPVYGKGENLDAISAYYFTRTGGIIRNHHLKTLAPNVWLVQKADPILVEMVFRKYLTGSGWSDYSKANGPEQGSEFCGVRLRPGYRKNEKLDEVICTPTGKGAVRDFLSVPEMQRLVDEAKPEDRERVLNGDDPKLTIDIIRRNYKAFGLRRPEDLDVIIDAGFKLYRSIHRDLESKDQLFADTKWEFGYAPDGRIILMDECATPDSSRFWKKSEYIFVPAQNAFAIVQGDKQPFRDEIESFVVYKGNVMKSTELPFSAEEIARLKKEGQIVRLDQDKKALAAHWMNDEVLRDGVVRYCNMRETITGTQSQITTEPRKQVVLEALAAAGYLR